MTVHSSDDPRSQSSASEITWGHIGRQFLDGLRLRWDQWRHSKATWRCTVEELPPGAKALMLGTVGGVSGPLASVRAVQEAAEREPKGESTN